MGVILIYQLGFSSCHERPLFICNQDRNRSRAADELFKNRAKTQSAGLYYCDRPVTKEQFVWADAYNPNTTVQPVISKFEKMFAS